MHLHGIPWSQLPGWLPVLIVVAWYGFIYPILKFFSGKHDKRDEARKDAFNKALAKQEETAWR